MKEYLSQIIKELDSCDNSKFAELFVFYRMSFARKYQYNLLTSTFLGIDFFHILQDCIVNSRHWTEKGDYEENFRKLIKIGSQN